MNCFYHIKIIEQIARLNNCFYMAIKIEIKNQKVYSHEL